MESEIDVITHLLEVENQASSLIDQALAESNRRVLAAKAKSDEIFDSKYHTVIDELEKQYEDTIDSCNKVHKKTFDDYKNQILNANKDFDSFNSFMDKILSR